MTWADRALSSMQAFRARRMEAHCLAAAPSGTHALPQGKKWVYEAPQFLIASAQKWHKLPPLMVHWPKLVVLLNLSARKARKDRKHVKCLVSTISATVYL